MMRPRPETEWIQLDEKERQYVMSILREHWNVTGAVATRVAAKVLYMTAPAQEHMAGLWPFEGRDENG